MKKVFYPPFSFMILGKLLEFAMYLFPVALYKIK